jgi:transposase
MKEDEMTYTDPQIDLNAPKLLIALELSDKAFLARAHWRGKESQRQLAPTAEGLSEGLEQFRRKLKVPEGVEVVACFEAGRYGFWPARRLEDLGARCEVMDSAGIEVSRRRRRAKTDKLDVKSLLQLLIRRELLGEGGKAFRPIHVPSPEAEDERRLNRERERLINERKQHQSRIKDLLKLQGTDVAGSIGSLKLERLVDWAGKPLPPHLLAELQREQQRWRLVDEQVKAVERETVQLRRQGSSPTSEKARRLASLRGIGDVGSWTLSSELLGWRDFANRRQVGAAAGLVSVPYSTGDSHRDQGISKAGPGRIRALLVELAWGWLRHQPDSELSRWFQSRYADQGKRMRRIGIVAMARKLIIALWRYVEFGEVPAGARLKVAR